MTRRTQSTGRSGYYTLERGARGTAQGMVTVFWTVIGSPEKGGTLALLKASAMQLPVGVPWNGGPLMVLRVTLPEGAKVIDTSALPLGSPSFLQPDAAPTAEERKTAALYYLRDNKLSVGGLGEGMPAGIFDVTPNQPSINDFCASFEQAITDVLVEKTCRAAKLHKPKTIILGGGVSANKKIRETLQTTLAEECPDANFLTPEPKYAMDNGAMIAAAGYFQAQNHNFTSWPEIQADPSWEAYL